MKGQVYKRCGCRDPETGKQLGRSCPRLAARNHGTWWARYQAPGPRTGRRQQPTLGPFALKREAEDALARVFDRINSGTYVGLDRQRFDDYLQQWLKGKTKLKPLTRLSYETHIRLYYAPGLGHLELSELRDHHFEDLYEAMRQIGRLPEGARPSPLLKRLLDVRTDTPQARRPLSPARLHRVHSTAISALNSAVRRRRLAHNPAQYVELESGKAPRALVWTEPRVIRWRETGRRPSPVMVWTPMQTAEFLDLAAADRLYPLWHLMIHRGLRRAEIVHLDWADVDLDAGRLTVREQDNGGADADVWSPKTEAGNRTIGLDARTVSVLREQRESQEAERRLWDEAWVDSGRVFTKEDGTMLNPDSVSQRFDRLVVRHNLPPVRLHDLRHGAATLALAAGADIKVVSYELGHASTQITQDLYTSVLPQVSQAAADAVAALLASSREMRAQTAAEMASEDDSEELLGHRAHTSHTRPDKTDAAPKAGTGKTAGQTRWG